MVAVNLKGVLGRFHYWKWVYAIRYYHKFGDSYVKMIANSGHSVAKDGPGNVAGLRCTGQWAGGVWCCGALRMTWRRVISWAGIASGSGWLLSRHASVAMLWPGPVLYVVFESSCTLYFDVILATMCSMLYNGGYHPLGSVLVGRPARQQLGAHPGLSLPRLLLHAVEQLWLRLVHLQCLHSLAW